MKKCAYKKTIKGKYILDVMDKKALAKKTNKKTRADGKKVCKAWS